MQKTAVFSAEKHSFPVSDCRYLSKNRADHDTLGVNLSPRTSLRNFLEVFDKASKWLEIPLPIPNIKIASTKPKENL